MKIYLIERPDRVSWDEYESAVVIAASEEDAAATHPGGTALNANPWSSETWVASPKDVIVTLIGTAESTETPRVVCSSFNAG